MRALGAFRYGLQPKCTTEEGKWGIFSNILRRFFPDYIADGRVGFYFVAYCRVSIMDWARGRLLCVSLFGLWRAFS